LPTFSLSQILSLIHLTLSLTSKKLGGEGSPRQGSFVHLGPREVLVHCWNPETEDFYLPRDMDPEETEKYKFGVHHFDSFLGI